MSTARAINSPNAFEGSTPDAAALLERDGDRMVTLYDYAEDIARFQFARAGIDPEQYETVFVL